MEKQKDIRKVFIRDYGNLTLEIIKITDIMITAWSEKRKETLYIPLTSIIMMSKIRDE